MSTRYFFIFIFMIFLPLKFLFILSCESILLLSILFLFFKFGINGVRSYNFGSVLIANVFMFNTVDIGIMNIQVPLFSMMLFATTLLCSDIISEHFGRQEAQKTIAYTVYFQFGMLILIGFGLFVEGFVGSGSVDYAGIMFSNQLKVLISSAISYSITQTMNVYIFDVIKRKTKNKYLFLRSSVSSLSSTYFDDILFTGLLFGLISRTEGVSLLKILATYVPASYAFKLIAVLLSNVIMYRTYDNQKVTKK